MGAPLTRLVDGQRLEFRAEPYRGQRDLRVCEIFVKRERTRWVFLATPADSETAHFGPIRASGRATTCVPRRTPRHSRPATVGAVTRL